MNAAAKEFWFLTGQEVRSMMSKHNKTIRGIAHQYGLTIKRVREVRENGISGATFVRDWMDILAA